LSRAEILERASAREATAVMATTGKKAGAANLADLGPTLAAEVCRLDEEGRELQIRASRLARDARPEFEAWFEAGLALRRVSERLAEIARRLDLPA
jgi:hypothetical protein